MARVEKNVFISYRRADEGWATAIYRDLRHRGFDVFIDYRGIGSGSFEREILENIAARAHFIVLLTPNALDRVNEPGDWMRKEVEHAMELQRNLIPVLFRGFSFNAPAIATQLTGPLAMLPRYNSMLLPETYFEEAMNRLEHQFLNKAVETVLRPASPTALQAATRRQAAADAAAVKESAQGLETEAVEPSQSKLPSRSMPAPPYRDDPLPIWQQPFDHLAFEEAWNREEKSLLPLLKFVDRERRPLEANPRVGDVYRLHLRARQRGYLTLLMRGTSGTWLLAYPGSRWPGVELEPEKTYTYPDELTPLTDITEAMDLEFGDPGTEVVVAICSSHPLTVSAAVTAADEALPPLTTAMVVDLLCHALSVQNVAFGQCSVQVRIA